MHLAHDASPEGGTGAIAIVAASRRGRLERRDTAVAKRTLQGGLYAGGGAMSRSVAEPRHIHAISECIAQAFAADPVWAVALARSDGRTDHHLPYWRLFVEGALQHQTVYLLDGGAAVSVWLPPDAPELAPEQERGLEDLLLVALDEDARTSIHALYRRFEASRAAVPARHAYLSLLATHPDHRGRGVGQALLAADLAAWDAAGIPTYLESTNPANDHRYARAGFVPVGEFRAVRDGSPITAMWRDVGGASAA
jgi:GNAT superfamily N-acetyltransferase